MKLDKSGQLNALAPLPLENEPSVPTEQENGWDPESNTLERVKPLVLAWHIRHIHIKLKLYTFLSPIPSIEHLSPLLCNITICSCERSNGLILSQH